MNAVVHDIEQVKEKILEAETVLISCHLNPDGDAIGSLLSLGLGLRQLGKAVCLVSHDPVPEKYMFLPGARLINSNCEEETDIAIAVDCSRKEMLGDVYEAFKKAHTIIEIDHHEKRVPFGHLSIVDSKASAVGELVYILLKELKVDINSDIAKSILTSIIVETNSFRIPNVRQYTFEICADLLSTGINTHKLISKVFWDKTKESVVLSGLCLSRCKFMENDRIAWTIVRQKDFELNKGKDEDVKGVVGEMRSVKGVEAAIFFREKNENILRVSLRAKGRVDLAEIALYYGGGGHYDAAGCEIPNNELEINKFLLKISETLKSIS